MKRKETYVLFLLFIIWLLTGLFKVRLYDKYTRFLSNDDFGLLRVEAAFRYRYAKMVAEGKSIPAVDYRIQYPEGLKVFDTVTLTSEITIGKLYRILPLKRIPFHVFLISFMFFFSSISVFAVYLVSKAVSRSTTASLASVLFYATAFPSFARTLTGGLTEEDFALCPLFLGTYFFFRSVEDKKLSLAALSAFLLAVPLTSWHFSQFFFFIFLVFVILGFFLSRDAEFLTKNFAVVAGFYALFGALVHILRVKQFVFSYPMLLSYALLATHYLQRKRIIRDTAVKIIFFAAFSLLMLILITGFASKHKLDWSHVYSLLSYKLRYLGQKPSYSVIVEKIPFDAKVTWQAGFKSPGIRDVLSNFSLLFLLALYGMVHAANKFLKGKSSLFETGALYFVVVFLPVYLLFERMYVFLLFFLAPFVALSVGELKKKIPAPMLAMILCAALIFNADKSVSKAINVIHRIKDYRLDVIRWLASGTGRDEAVLADIGISPEIALYAGNPTVLHNYYDVADIRAKTEKYYRSLFKNERDFYDMCRDYRVDYVLHEWDKLIDVSKGSIRYQINATNVYKDSAVYLFNFEPENLKYFTLVYQNNNFRAYKVGRERKKPPARFDYVPFFDRRIFVNEGEEIRIKGDERGPVFDDDFAQKVMTNVWNIPGILASGNAFRKKGMFEEALSEYRRIVAIDPYMPRARLTLGEFYLSLQKYGDAERELNEAIMLDPHLLEAYDLLSVACFYNGDEARAGEVIKKALAIAPENPMLKKRMEEIKAATEK